MEEEGMKSMFDVSLINDKQYHIYNKTYPYRSHDDLKYKFASLYNKAWYRHVIDMHKLISKANILNEVYLARPSIILSLENEMLTWRLMQQLTSKILT